MESYSAPYGQIIGPSYHNDQWVAVTRIRRSVSFASSISLQARMSSYIATHISRCARYATLRESTLLLPDPMQIPSSRGRLDWRYPATGPRLFKPDFPPAFGLPRFMPPVLITTLHILVLTVSPVILRLSVSNRRRKMLISMENHCSLGLR